MSRRAPPSRSRRSARPPTSSRSSRATPTCAAPGARFTGLCPFHDERTPSFSVDPSAGLYYCFGCQAGGDVFGFLMEKEGLEFREAVEQLADRYGVELAFDSKDPGEEQRRRGRERLLELLTKTARFYERYLWESGRGARRARLPREPRPRARRRSRSSASASPRAPGTGCSCAPSRTASTSRSCTTPASPSAAAQGGIYDRFRGADHVPAARHPRPGARLRRARAARGPAAEVRQLARDRGLPQGPLAVRHRPRPPARDARGPGDRGRGLHGRDRAPPGRHPQRRRLDGHRAHGRAGRRAGPPRPHVCCSPSTPTARAARRCCAFSALRGAGASISRSSRSRTIRTHATSSRGRGRRFSPAQGRRSRSCSSRWRA